jgi:SAM-dependent methyltransferase
MTSTSNQSTVREIDPAILDKYADLSRYPHPAENEYLHLLDLRDALRRIIDSAEGTWLDFGTPMPIYDVFMPHAKVETADVTEGIYAPLRPPTYEFRQGERCPAPDGHFDGILSTQVLEHVPEPRAYLADALRMLRPGGRLALTVPGIWEDHHDEDGSNGDYRRWTAQGLRRDLETAGFAVHSVLPLTCGFRGLTTLALTHLKPVHAAGQPRTISYRTKLALFRGFARLVNLSAETLLRKGAVGKESDLYGVGRLYVALLADAQKP